MPKCTRCGESITSGLLIHDDCYYRLIRNLKDCRNELCFKCGDYKERHKGACDGCRWKEPIE
jgi:hypothetical protein